MVANEQWKPVNGYTRYEVSSTGNVRNIHTKQMKAQRITKTGYLITDLKENGKKHTAYIHRLVAEAFVENAFSFPCVNHIDENKQNNHADNLEWCTVTYNNAYGTHNQKIKKTKTERYGKRIAQIDIDAGCVLCVYPSIVAAAKSMQTTHQAIMWALKAANHTASGYRWVVME